MDRRFKSTASDPSTDRRTPTPLYHQIYLQLRQQIVDGHYSYEARLPSEIEIGERFGVSRITARRAMGELARSGYVIRRPRHGTSVIWKGPSAPIEASVNSVLDSMRLIGRTRVSVLSVDDVPAPPHVAAALGIEAGTRVQKAERIRLVRAGPLSYVISYIPAEIGSRITAADLARRPMIELLAVHGNPPAGGENRLTATAADTHTASLLKIEAGSPLLKVIGIVTDANGRPMAYVTTLYRPDRFQFTIQVSDGTTLARDNSADILTDTLPPHLCNE